MVDIFDIFQKVNKKIVFIVLTIIFSVAVIYFAWYWYGIIQQVKWGQYISLNNSFLLKMNGRAYYKKDKIQIQFIEITDSRCQPGKICIQAGDLGAQFSATNYKDGRSAKFYLSKTMVPQMPLFDLQMELLDVNTNNNTVTLKITKGN